MSYRHLCDPRLTMRGTTRTPGAVNTRLRSENGNLGNGVIGVARNPSNDKGRNLPKRLNGPPVTPKPAPSKGKTPPDENDHGMSCRDCPSFADSARNAS